jgi:hypothetical protein
MIPYGRQHITAGGHRRGRPPSLRSRLDHPGAGRAALRAGAGGLRRPACGGGVQRHLGLHIACLALGLGPGDRLWTSPNTFVASANCGLYCGAKVDFVDIDPQDLQHERRTLAAKLEAAEPRGRLPKVVMPVHFAGQACDMRAIHALGQRYGFRIIEDASHAIGGATWASRSATAATATSPSSASTRSRSSPPPKAAWR